MRKAAGAASRALAGHSKVVSTLSAIDLTAAAEGHLLGAYVFDTYKKPGKPPVESIVLTVESAAEGVQADPGPGRGRPRRRWPSPAA